MSDKLDWTQKLGDAVLAQQTDVTDSIQRLRARADANDKLKTTKQQKVTKKSEGGKQYITIEPTDPQTVYVPYYDPAVVYGAWPYPAYPPYYWGASYWPGGGALLATGLAFGAGYAVGRWASGGNYWGGGVNWGGNNINVNRPININNSGNNWQHIVQCSDVPPLSLCDKTSLVASFSAPRLLSGNSGAFRFGVAPVLPRTEGEQSL